MFFDNFNPINLRHDPRYHDRLGKDAACGCSMTCGDGVSDLENWPFLMGLYNIGQPASSNDEIARLSTQYINTYPDIDNFYVLWTFTGRREYVTQDNDIKTFTPNFSFSPQTHKTAWQFAFVELSNEYYDAYNLEKNKQLVEHACARHGIKLHQLNISDTDYQKFPLGFDHGHPGAQWHRHVVNLFKKIAT